jgi:SulP family sulfate permease
MTLSSATSISKRSFSGDVSGGVTACLLALPESMAYGALTFAALGPAFVPAGVAAGLLALGISNIASGLVRGAIPILHTGNYSLAALMCASAVTYAAGRVGAAAPIDARLAPALVAAMLLTVFLAGLFQIIFGVLRFGVLTKYIPQPVLSGLMNGTAILMLIAQVAPMLGLAKIRSFADFPVGAQPLTLVVGLATCAGIYFGARVLKPVPVPFKGMAVGATVYYGLVALGFGDRLGSVIGNVPGGVPTPKAGLDIVRLVSGAEIPPSVLFGLIPYAFGLAVIVSLRSLLACLAADEVLGVRSKSSQELVAQGVGNMACAVFGAVASTGSLSRSAANYHYGGRTRFSRVASGVAAVLILVVFHRGVGALPNVVLAGMLVMLAFACFDPWSLKLLRNILRSRRRPRGQDVLDLAIALFVTGTMVFVGVFESIGIGILLAVIFFVVSMGRSIIRREYDGSLVRANVLRPRSEIEILGVEGRRIRAYELEGALFFGTADRVAEAVESVPPQDVSHVILECKRISFIDSTGLKVISRLARSCQDRGVTLAVSHLPANVPAPDGVANFASTFDALLTAEDQLLDGHLPAERYHTEWPLDRGIGVLSFFEPAEIDLLRPYLRRRVFVADDVIFREGDAGDRLFVIVKGRVRLMLPNRAKRDGIDQRLSTLCPGTIMGEMALLDGNPRSADAVAEGELVCFELDRPALERLKSEHPPVAFKLLTGVSAEISARLRLANAQYRFFARS